VGKFLKPCIGLSVGKLVRSVQVTAKLSTELRSSGSKFGSQKFGRFGVRLMVARSSFRLAYNDLRANEGRETKALNCKPITNLKEKI
jgi:hypothetical protein